MDRFPPTFVIRRSTIPTTLAPVKETADDRYPITHRAGAVHRSQHEKVKVTLPKPGFNETALNCKEVN